MRDSFRLQRAALYALFMLSGFAGLIYESIWAHYLKLFLGHAAYAQTLVLAIFMGGMAIGAWWVGRRSARWRRPLLAYAIVEAVLGLCAFGFDPLFRGLQGWAFDSAIPALGAPLAIDALKWGLSTALILPQSILLGTTFPLMSAGVLRLAPQDSGRVLGWLYFSNSLGASVGVLASGFVLIAAVGLPGTMLTAGLVNVLLVGGVWLAIRDGADGAAPPAPAAAAGGSVPRLLLAVALFTGLASFFYEIGWIRMLSLVLGSATHSFELMLSAFILGLALGSFFIRGRIDALREPLRALGWVQAAMAALALGTVLLYPATFEWMAAILRSVQRSDGGYALYLLLSHGICIALMLPVTFCAGMTLPLITHLLLKAGHGEAAIGRVYAANTVGAIAGILLAVHGVMPLLGLRHVIVVGALVDLVLGLWLLRAAPAGGRLQGAAVTALVAACVAVAIFSRFDPARLASGVYRTGVPRLPDEVMFHRDGKTASIDVIKVGTQLQLATNGKVDGALSFGDAPSPDDAVQVLLGALPVLSHAAPSRAAVIGLGTGRSTHALLQDPRVEAIDTIEIEPAVVAGARLFGPLVAAAFEDPRSRIHIEDAKTFFSRGQGRYDLIVSEPSNPWVSGVASLFSEEFYRQAHRHLADQGLLVQWLQLYEFDTTLVASVLRALGRVFPDYVVYLADDSNLVVLSGRDDPVPPPRLDRASPEMRELLGWIGLRTPANLAAMRIGNRAELEPFVNAGPLPANSDFFPVLDQNAARHRFLQSDARALGELRTVTDRLARRPPPERVTLTPATRDVHAAQALARMLRGERAAGDDAGDALRMATHALAWPAVCRDPALAADWLYGFEGIAIRLLPYLGVAEGRAVGAAFRHRGCPPSEGLVQWLALIEAEARRDWPQVRMLARELLAGRDPADGVAQSLLTEVLLADLLAGETAEARRARESLRDLEERSLPARLVLGHIDAQGE